MHDNIFGFSHAELQHACTTAGFERFRGAQLFHWLYQGYVNDFEHCLNMPKAMREELARRFTIIHPIVTKEQTSRDGTRKFLLQLGDGRSIESVLIPAETDDTEAPKRLTLCVSTQVGCPLDCRFCATASMKLKRNLTAGEIVGQYLAAQHLSEQRITNIVFMGMGEPMLNYDNVMAAVEILTHEKACGLGAGRITISTAGLADGIRRLAEEQRKIKLAVSLHATTDGLRQRLMPINKKYPLAEIFSAVEYYHQITRMRVTWEYIMFDGLNDRDEDMHRLVKISRRVPCKINLIPFHPVDATFPDDAPDDLAPTPRHRIADFAERLRDNGVVVMLRSSSGKDIDAACGQLAVRHASPP